MKRLQILQFKNIYHQIYTLDNAGDYHNPDTNTKYHLLTCLFNNLQINQIKDKDNNRIFTLGEEIIVNSGKVTITKINLVGNAENFQAQFKLSDNSTVLMPNVTKVPPVIPVTNNSLNDLEAKILKDFNNRTLKFNVFVRKKSETFEQFKKEFFARNNEFATIWSDTKTEQTSAGRRRSLGDIFMICKYYYPSITLLEVVKWLYSAPYFKGQFCGAVNKRVWRISGYDVMHHEDMKDEYGNLTSYYKTFIK